MNERDKNIQRGILEDEEFWDDYDNEEWKTECVIDALKAAGLLALAIIATLFLIAAYCM